MNIVEKVARALWISQNPDKEIDPWWQHCIPDARAAIEAMREPTDAMIDAVGMVGGTSDPDLIDLARGVLRDQWRAMIDAALSENEKA